MQKSVAAAVVAGSLLAGGVIGAALFGPSAIAQTTTSTTQPDQRPPGPSESDGRVAPPFGAHHHDGLGGPMFDPSVAADAIGISEADLFGALKDGQSIADVATANGVDAQTVIDALVAAAKQDIAAKVDSGTLTQDQADAIEADLEQRITDHVNGVFPGPDGCHGMGGGPGRPHAPPDGTPTTPPEGSGTTAQQSGFDL